MSTVISVISVFIAFFSLGISLYIYKLSRVDSSYLDIDNQYKELLKLGMETTDLRNYAKTSKFYKIDDDDDFKKKYAIYAYMCWNLVETIYDRQKDTHGRFHLSETWVPVMFEENRLHYSWFKHNLRLFKREFQNFVTEELNDILIEEGSVNDLRALYSNFERDFPRNERKSFEHLETLILKNHYKLLLARHKVFEEVVGYALVYLIEEPKLLWLDYMAVEEKYQNAGYGTLLFNKIIECNGTGRSGMFLEVEIPENNATDKIKRITFYERLHAKQLNCVYKLPTVDGGLQMYLYYKKIANETLLPAEVIKKAILSTYNYIHTDIDNRESIFQSFIGTIVDEILDLPGKQ